jgi:hypothetical protein
MDQRGRGLLRVAARVDLRELASANIDRKEWPGAVVDLYLGRVDPRSFKVTVSAGVDRVRLCVLHFYLATFEPLKDMQDEARPDLQATVDTCMPGSIAFAAAKAEFARLSRSHSIDCASRYR